MCVGQEALSCDSLSERYAGVVINGDEERFPIGGAHAVVAAASGRCVVFSNAPQVFRVDVDRFLGFSCSSRCAGSAGSRLVKRANRARASTRFTRAVETDKYCAMRPWVMRFLPWSSPSILRSRGDWVRRDERSSKPERSSGRKRPTHFAQPPRSPCSAP
jgi:hypothetical protein